MDQHFWRKKSRASVQKASRKASATQRFLEQAFTVYYVVFGVFGFIVLLSHQSQLIVREVVIEGTKAVDAQQLIVRAEEALRKKTLRLIRDDSMLWYPRERIAGAVYASDHRIRSVDVSHHQQQTLDVIIDEENTEMLWCGTEIPTTTLRVFGGCYAANTAGKIFAQAPVYHGYTFPVYFSRPTKAPQGTYPREDAYPLGYVVIADPQMHFLGRIREEIARDGYVTYAMGLTEDNDATFFIKGGLVIIFQLDRDIEVDLSRLKAFREAWKGSKGLGKDGMSSLDELKRIDMRFANKVYYE